MERFWAKVDKNGPPSVHRPELGPCWLWRGYTDKRGYGRFSDGKKYGTVSVHRIMWLTQVGPIPEGYEIDHLCFIPSCVRLEHLRCITQHENRVTKLNTGKTTRVAGNFCAHGHPWADNLYVRPNGDRHCRECMRIAMRRYHAEHRAEHRAEQNAKRRARRVAGHR